MEIRVVDYYEDKASLFSSSDTQSGEDGKAVPKYVAEANTVHTTTLSDDEISTHNPDEVVRNEIQPRMMTIMPNSFYQDLDCNIFF